jgi:hypothetical protein
VEPELFKVAMRAILQKQEVTLEHRSVKRRGEVKQKTIEPLHLAMINHALYLWHYDASLVGKKEEKSGKGPGREGRDRCCSHHMILHDRFLCNPDSSL